MTISVTKEKCNGCGICADICPEDVLVIENKLAKAVYPEECWYCGTCMMDCKQDAIKVIFPRFMRPVVIKGTRD